MTVVISSNTRKKEHDHIHRPDLPLIGDTDKVGLGLYNYPLIAFSLEAIVLFAGLWLYMRSTTGKTFMGKYGMYIFAIFLLLMNALTYWGPRMQSTQVIAIFNETFYLVTAAIAVWLDRKRSPKGQAHPVPATQMNTISTPVEVSQEV